MWLWFYPVPHLKLSEPIPALKLQQPAQSQEYCSGSGASPGAQEYSWKVLSVDIMDIGTGLI